MDARTSTAEPSPASAEGKGANVIVQEAQRHKLLTAALIGGAVAAGAGAYIGTRALARRNGAGNGQPLNSVMETAITACDLGTAQSANH
jgi:hypothetical protein